MGSNTVCYWSMTFSSNVVKCISDTFPVVSISYNSIMHIQHENRLPIKWAINLWLGTFKKCWGNCIHNDVIFQLLPFLFLVVVLVLKLAECLHCPDSIYKKGSLKLKKSHLLSVYKMMQDSMRDFNFYYCAFYPNSIKLSQCNIK